VSHSTGDGLLQCAITGYDSDPASLSGTGLPPNHDLDVFVDRRQKAHQAFDGKACQLVVAKHRPSAALFPVLLRHQTASAHCKHVIQHAGQPKFRLALGCVWKSEVSKHVSSAMTD
jgi:hypothetical protein